MTISFIYFLVILGRVMVCANLVFRGVFCDLLSAPTHPDGRRREWTNQNSAAE